MRREFDITIKLTSSEDNLLVRINVFTGEFNRVFKFFIESLRAFKVRIHFDKKEINRIII